MTRDAAETLVVMLLDHAKQQNQFLIEARSNFTPEDFEESRLMIGKTMGSMYLDALYPLFCQHPSLEPPELVAGRTSSQ